MKLPLKIFLTILLLSLMVFSIVCRPWNVSKLRYYATLYYQDYKGQIRQSKVTTEHILHYTLNTVALLSSAIVFLGLGIKNIWEITHSYPEMIEKFRQEKSQLQNCIQSHKKRRKQQKIESLQEKLNNLKEDRE